MLGSLTSTKMACENSQKAVFTETIANVNIYLVTDHKLLVLVLKDVVGLVAIVMFVVRLSNEKPYAKTHHAHKRHKTL